MIETIYLCRHAARSDWEKSADGGTLPTYSAVTGHWQDAELSTLGIQQAEELGTFLASQPDIKDRSQTIIVSSPYYRCLQTAAPLARATGMLVNVEGGLAEWYTPPAEGTGLYASPDPSEYPAAILPARLESTYESMMKVVTTGERIEALQARAGQLASGLFQHLERQYPAAKTVVVFTHAAMVIALGEALTPDRNTDFIAFTACCNRFRLTGAGQSDGPNGPSWMIDWQSRIDFLSEPNSARPFVFARYLVERTRPDGTIMQDRGQPLDGPTQGTKPMVHGQSRL